MNRGDDVKELLSTIDRLTSELSEMREAMAAAICYDAHCEFDCEGWRAAVETFRKSHGVNTASLLIEEFNAAEAERDTLRSALSSAEQELDDWRNSARRAAEGGHEDEKHCACVGTLRVALSSAEERVRELTSLLQEIGGDPHASITIHHAERIAALTDKEKA